MAKEFPTTKDIIQLIGTPFIKRAGDYPSDEFLLYIYNKAFQSRVAPIYLQMYRHDGWHPKLEEYFNFVRNREAMTLTVLSDLAATLNELDSNGYVIFKSIKPYPAIPNDTDVLIFGGKKEFETALQHLYACGYIFHEWAPLQTTIYDPRGKGKIGKGKKGGTYYIDVYREISTDYIRYLSKEAVYPYVIVKNINGIEVRLLKPEPELAVILFHNVFPERTYELEHFYMPLFNLANPQFDLDLFVSFVEENSLTPAVSTNLTLVEELHGFHFGFVPPPLKKLLDHWGRNNREAKLFRAKGLETPYMFSPWIFGASILNKLRDSSCLSSIGIQFIHMLNPVFFWDVVKALRKRFSERGVYHME